MKPKLKINEGNMKPFDDLIKQLLIGLESTRPTKAWLVRSVLRQGAGDIDVTVEGTRITVRLVYWGTPELTPDPMELFVINVHDIPERVM
jgi:hypothetical protein